MIKLGVLVKDLLLSQVNYQFITQANRFYSPKHTGEIDIIAFYNSLSMHCAQLFFSCMNIKEAWSYDGTIIATSINTAKKLIAFPSSKKKIFYVYDLEWITDNNYQKFADIYQNKGLTLIARSESHAKILEQCWGTKITDVVEDFNIRKIMSLTNT